jgi:uncharacterized oxidoreductase
MRSGEVKPGQQASIVVDAGPLVVVDGHMGFGQVIGEQAMDILIARSKASGIALVSIRNCGHLGRTGDWAERVARAGLISLHFMNTTGRGMMVTPFGGTDRRLSLCPLSICLPVEGRDPILLDITTAMSAEGKIFVAKNRGAALPPGTIIDKHGKPSVNPNDFYEGGAVLPMGGHRGSGLNIVVDMLAGILSGGGCTAPGTEILVNTMTSIAIDPQRLVDRHAYTAEILRFAEHVKGSPPAEPGGEVLLPGEVEQRTRAARTAEGVPIDDTTWEQILASGEAVGVSRAETTRLAGLKAPTLTPAAAQPPG